MKLALSLCLLSFGVFIASCSTEISRNNGSPPDVTSVPTAESHSSPTVENDSSPNPNDVVIFDGKNYIKKNGWKIPSRKDIYKDDTYDGGLVQRTTESGKRVETTTTRYFYKTTWLYSQDFYFEGSGLDWMKGQLESPSFLEMSVKGKVFFYSIFTEKIMPPPQSNNDPHEDPFRYKIMDADGDGIFETLLGKNDDIVVPDWVLK
jgi:hypothetical protein